MTNLSILITNVTYSSTEIQHKCKQLGFNPSPYTLRQLSKYGDIQTKDTHILGFGEYKNASRIEIITKHEQKYGKLPKGYLVIESHKIGLHYRPFECLLLDEEGNMYNCPYYNGQAHINSKKPLYKSLHAYIIDTLENHIKTTFY